MQEPQVAKQVDNLLLTVVAAAERTDRRQALAPELLLVPLGVGSGGEEEHDLARGRGALVDELAHTPRDRTRLRAAPVLAGVLVARLVGDEQLDRVAEHGRLEFARGGERLEAVAELGLEQVVDRREHLRPRAVVAREREHLTRGGASLAEDADVRVAEAVDRLELVPDDEDVEKRLGHPPRSHLRFLGRR